MDGRANGDVLFLPDEKFDFDVPLSPASSKGDEDDDEVFVGPVSHKERCISVSVASQLVGSGGDVRMSWSPLTGDQLEAVCLEAHKVADQLQTSSVSLPYSENNKTPNVTTETATNSEEFVQDAEGKLGVLGQTASALSPIKRQTFCVQDSPMKQLPPAIQHRLLKGGSSNAASSKRLSSGASSTRLAPTHTNSFTRPAASARLSTSSPVARAKSQPRTGLRGRASLGVGVVLPSKPAAPTTSCSATKNRVEKTRLQPPSKVGGGLRRSPASRPSSRAESCEDLLSDSMSVASDISDSSLNSSLLGKRTLAPPTRNVKRDVKAPPLQTRRATDRKNTSSSSSSVSSFNSSLSLSPAKGKLNSSLNRSLSASTGPAPSSISRPATHSRPRRSTTATATVQPSSTASRRSLSAQTKKPPEVESVKTVRSTPLKRAVSTPLQLTPAKRVLDRTAAVPPSASARPQSALKTRSKPEALVPPTPNGGVRVPHRDDVSKMLKPKRLVSLSSMDSLPLKPSAGPMTPSAGSCKSLQVKVRRPSALPTPVKRRMSAIPVATPTNQTRITRQPLTSDFDPARETISPRRERSSSPAPPVQQELEPVDAPDIQPFCLEEEEPPAVSPSSPPQTDQSGTTLPGVPSQAELEPNRNLIELEATEEGNNKTQEVLLLDLPAPALQPQEKLLIDLTNTPNLIRNSNKTCTTTQLIDLSSPLIKWSPEDKRENAPLINLSF